MGRRIDLVVMSYQPGTDAVLVHRDTEIKISEKPVKEAATGSPRSPTRTSVAWATR